MQSLFGVMVVKKRQQLRNIHCTIIIHEDNSFKHFFFAFNLKQIDRVFVVVTMKKLIK